jgi:hypothetical protein
MIIDYYFSFLGVIVLVYVLLGNYLYFCKILPAIRKAPGILPWTQVQHLEEYLDLVEGNKDRPWFYYYLQNIKTISIILLLMMLMFPIVYKLSS